MTDDLLTRMRSASSLGAAIKALDEGADEIERLNAKRDSLRCPNCDKLRLELGEQRQRAERAEAELAREKAAVYDMVEACKRAEAERDALRALLAEARGMLAPDKRDPDRDYLLSLDARIGRALRNGNDK